MVVVSLAPPGGDSSEYSDSGVWDYDSMETRLVSPAPYAHAQWVPDTPAPEASVDRLAEILIQRLAPKPVAAPRPPPAPVLPPPRPSFEEHRRASRAAEVSALRARMFG
jgi:hypothetical protein